MTNTEPVVSIEECDRETCREFLGEYYGTAQDFDDALLMKFAAHRTTAVAKREAEIVGKLNDIAFVMSMSDRDYSSEFVADMVRKVIAKIQTGRGV